MTEVELAKKVIEFLQNQHWEVYQEVSRGFGEPVIDIVAKQATRTWAIETKTSISLVLLEQAYRSLQYANYVSIAIPDRRKKGSLFYEMACRQFGIGCLKVFSNCVRETVRPKINRIPKWANISIHLTEQQKTFAEAGNNKGQRWTPFQQTVQNIYDYLHQHPGATLKQVIDNVDHHYQTSATAKSCIALWIRKGIIQVRHEREGKFSRLYKIEDTG